MKTTFRYNFAPFEWIKSTTDEDTVRRKPHGLTNDNEPGLSTTPPRAPCEGCDLRWGRTVRENMCTASFYED